MPIWVGEVLLPLWDSLVRQLLGLLDLNGRLGLAFLTVSYLVAYVLYRRRRASGRTRAASFWQFLGGAAVHAHPSVWLDCRYYLLRVCAQGRIDRAGGGAVRSGCGEGGGCGGLSDPVMGGSPTSRPGPGAVAAVWPRGCS